VILREVLHAHIPTLLETSTVRDAVDKMDIYQFPALVVTTPELAVVAVVTEGDVARAVVQRGQLSQLSEEPILPFATKDPYTAGPDREVSDALHDMLSRGLTVLPITDEGRLIGMVLRVDLMQAILMDASTQTNPA
jgi:CBS domain-containing protein